MKLKAQPRDVLKLLNDSSAGDLRELSDDEIRSFEATCEKWRTFVQAELARRASLPRETGARAGPPAPTPAIARKGRQSRRTP